MKTPHELAGLRELRLEIEQAEKTGNQRIIWLAFIRTEAPTDVL